MTYIYLLHSTDDRFSVYIGKTRHPDRRLREHRSRRAPSHTRLGKWIRSIDPRTVELVVLEETENDWRDAEKFWIAYYRSMGARVLNGTDGGEGFEPDPETYARWLKSVRESAKRPEVRENISRAQSIAQNRPEVRARLSRMMKERCSDPDFLARRSASIRAAMSDPEYRSGLSRRSKEQMSDPEAKARLTGMSLEECLKRRDEILRLKSTGLRPYQIVKILGSKMVFSVCAGKHWTCKI